MRHCLVLAVVLILSVPVWSQTPAEARALLEAGNLGEAEASARQALARLEGASEPALADALDALVEVLVASDRAAEPETLELAERAVGLRRVAGGEPVVLASSLTRLGEVLTAAEKLDAAAVALTEAEALLPPDDGRGRGRVLNRLAAVRQAQGDWPEAARLCAAALAVLELATRPGDAERNKALTGLGSASYKTRDFSAAQRAYRALLEEQVATLGEGDVAVGTTLHRLARSTAAAGDLPAAEGLYRRAIANLGAALGPDSLRVGSAVVNLAIVIRKRGDYLEARRLLERALAIFENELGPEHPFAAGTLNNLGSVLLNLGDLPAAREAYERGLTIRERSLGPDSLEVAQSLTNLGNLALKEDEVGRAVPLFERSLAIRERAQGVDAPSVGLTLSNLGEALQQVSQLERAQQALERAVRVLERSPGQAWNLAAALNNLGLVRLRQERLAEAATTLERAERALGEASPPFARDRLRTRLGLEEVVSSVPPGSALVAYARFRRRFTQDPKRRYEALEPWYLAFVRTPAGTVEVLPLVDAATVERLVQAWRAAASRPAGAERAAFEAGELLRETIWDPLARRLGAAERVFVVPDGELGLVNVAALPAGPDTFLVEQGPLLVVLDQEQDLVPDPYLTVSGPCLLALGAPDYDAAPGSPAQARLAATEGPSQPTRSTPRGLTDMRFAPLPGTAAETAEVAALWTGTDPRSAALRLVGE